MLSCSLVSAGGQQLDQLPGVCGAGPQVPPAAAAPVGGAGGGQQGQAQRDQDLHHHQYLVQIPDSGALRLELSTKCHKSFHNIRRRIVVWIMAFSLLKVSTIAFTPQSGLTNTIFTIC